MLDNMTASAASAERLGSAPFHTEFNQLELQLQSRLSAARARFRHPGDKGTSAEAALREVLRAYLPRRLAIGQGEVIDTFGRRSRQTDIVVADEDHPFTFTEDLPGLFVVEGVSAAGEVKAVLTGGELESAIAKSREFKQLTTEQPIGSTIHASESDRDRFYRCPPFFLFAYESQLALPTIQQRLIGESGVQPAVDTSLLDAVFVLGAGSVINFGDGRGKFMARDANRNPLSGWVRIEESGALFGLMAWLSVVMPRVHRFGPILAPYLVPSA